MDVTLDPIIREKLEAFGRRRRRLILIRGGCAALTLLLTTMSLIALADWLFVLSDLLRLALSGLAYAAVLAGVWITCARLVLRRPGPRELARFIEKVRPELREDLLSAVELGEPRGEEIWDSPAFRKALQEDVAGRLRDVTVQELLSWRRIGRWIRAAAGLLLACAALLMVPGLSFDHLLLRSMLPVANLERLSRVRVSVLAPDPPDAIVPEGDVLTIQVSTSGPSHGAVLLETFPQGRPGERLEMKDLGGRKYESVLALGREALDYRIRAGDAVTRRYHLRTRPRPEVVRFHKTFRLPEYARRPAFTISAENGDLEALEGTEVDLELEVNQEIHGGELRMDQGGQASVRPLEKAGPRRLRTRLHLAASGLYRVHLVAAETGFENKFSPQYEIRALPDRVPSVTLEEPAQDLIVPPDEIILIRGTARDDVGVERVVQKVRINQGEWTETPLGPKEPRLQVAVARSWDLFEQRVQPGDRLAVKLEAVDLKGNRAESAPVHVVVTSPGFNPQRGVPLEAKRMVYAALLALREAARSLEKKLQGAAPAAEGGEEIQRTQIFLHLAGEMETVSQQADAVEARLREALRTSRPGREAHDLILVGLLVRRVREDVTRGARTELQRLASPEEKGGDRTGLRRTLEIFRRAVDRAGVAEETYREILAAEEAAAAFLDLKDLVREETSIHLQVSRFVRLKDPRLWERLARRQGVAGQQIRAVEETLRALALRAREGMEKRAERIAQDLQNLRTQLEKALAEPPSEKFLAFSRAVQSQIEAAHAALHPLELELARRANRAREHLARRAEPGYGDIQQAARELQILAEAESKKAVEPGQAARAMERWIGARELLEARADQEECRRDADPFFVADSALAARALAAVLDTYRNVGGPLQAARTLREVEQAFRTLEAGHMLQELAIALREIGERERWEGTSAGAVVRRPKDWIWMDDRMKTIPAELRGGRMPAEAIQELQKTWQGTEADRARREMTERAQAAGRPPVPQADALERLGTDLGRVLLKIQPAMEEARAFLRKLIPSLPERLAQLAEEARKLEQDTARLARNAPQEDPSRLRPEVRQLLDQQQGLDRLIRDVMTHLRREANMQDLFTREGRERARDADDAVAMLTETPPKAEDLLTQAAAASEPRSQTKALEGASIQQDRMAKALETLAEHYRNMEMGRPEETRPELRKAEKALGIKETLDAQYGQMERLAELARQYNREALMQALENALAGSEAMQRKLEQLAQNALERAEAALQEAAAREEQVGQILQKMTPKPALSPPQAASFAEQARRIAEEARQMAERDAPRIARKIPATQPQAEAAARNLREAASAIPTDFARPLAAAQGLERAAQELREATQDLRAAQQAARQAADQARRDAQRKAQDSQAAQQRAQQAAQAAQQAHQAAQRAPTDPAAQQKARETRQAAQAAQQAAQSEAAQAQAAQQAVQNAQAGEEQATQSTQRAEQLAQQAQQLASQLRQQANPQLAQQAAQQDQIGQTLREAAEDVARAARHMERLGHSEQAYTFGQVAQETGAVARKEIPEAKQALEQAVTPQEAQPAVAAAERAIEDRLNSLSRARQAASPSPAPARPAASPGLSEAAAEFLANALNALDATPGPEEGPPTPGPTSSPTGSPSARQAMSSAAAAQAQALRSGRIPGLESMPGQAPSSPQRSRGGGASVETGELPEARLGPAGPLKTGDWGRLPPRLARDLMESRREEVSGEYRPMIETYFKVVAERAREKR